MTRWPRAATLLGQLLASAALLCLSVCDVGRELRQQTPTYERDVAQVLEARCAECHSGDEAEAGYRVGSYLEAIGCVEATGEPAVLPMDDTAPILHALGDDDHVDVLTSEQQQLLRGWVRGGVPSRHGAVHELGFANPRSAEFHGRLLRQERWSRVLTTEAPDACGRCHAGAPVVPEGVDRPAPEAPDCRGCHDGEGGVFSCETCHGAPGRAYPPSDPCFQIEGDEPVEGGAHEAHVEGGNLNGPTLTCTDCHPDRDTGDLAQELATGAHGDDVVDVEVTAELAGDEAAYDETAQQCTVACHDLGGTLSQPTWLDEGPLECDSCHLAPPEDHNPRGCDSCHVEANEEGTELEPGPLHMNGEADVAGGLEGCGACHGDGEDDPWPDTERHPNHLLPEIGVPVECETCHVVPEEIDDEGHIDDDTEGAEVTFGDAAGDDPTYDEAAQSCTVACHTLGGDREIPVWIEEGPLECGDCHRAPPEDHNPRTCDSCHADAGSDGDEMLVIDRHVNGQVDWSYDDERCGSCHGDGGDDPWPDSERHLFHQQPTIGPPVTCETCHVVPEAVDDVGHIDDETAGAEVIFSGLAGDAAVYDESLQSCTVACHTLGGARETPAWTDEGPLGCGDCHEAPPAGHNPATCDSCHGHAGPAGDELLAIDRHVDGEPTLGDGSGQCGACHGAGDDPAPRSDRHPAHLQPRLSAEVACDTCHLVPTDIDDVGHIDETLGAEVTLGGLAAARGATPSYLDQVCSDVACHGAGLPGFSAPAVRWDDETGAASRCGACHLIPPPPPHTTRTSCESLLCHGGEVAQWPEGPRITQPGRAAHVDGDVDVVGRAP